MPQKTKSFDIVIAGGGMAGLGLAAMLKGSGLNVLVLEKSTLKRQRTADGRTTALSFGTAQVLSKTGVWDFIKGFVCPIEDIRVYDGSSALLLNFLSAEAEGETLGWIVDNHDLLEALLSFVQEDENITLAEKTSVETFYAGLDSITLELSDKTAVKTKLLVGADGRGSKTREMLGIDTRGWSFKQNALVCVAVHEYPHNHAAVEHFWPEGPFALLPMLGDEQGGHRSAVVLTEEGRGKASFSSLNDEEFLAALQVRFPLSYGKILRAGPRGVYPLGLVHAERYTGERAALIADAAHGIHPIAGQGLNLGFRDIDLLSDLILMAHSGGEDVGNPELLKIYERRRRPDNVSMIAATNAINRLFGMNNPAFSFARKIGVRAIEKNPYLKRFFLKQAMGMR